MADDFVVIQFSLQLCCDFFPIEFSFLMMSAFGNINSEFLAQSSCWGRRRKPRIGKKCLQDSKGFHFISGIIDDIYFILFVIYSIYFLTITMCSDYLYKK